jgi:hypothetical protein
VSSQFKKYFTVVEATALLPRLVSILNRIENAQAGSDDISDEAKAIHHAAGGNGGGKVGSEILQHSARVAKHLEEINDLGVIVKDFQRGLLDFPHVRDGREVFLCWKKGEKEIAFWHELDAGFKGRQPL